MDYSLEPMGAGHRQPVIDIFNQFIRQSHAAFLDEPVSDSYFDHFWQMSRGYPAVVIRSAAQQVVGFAFLRPHYSPEAFRSFGDSSRIQCRSAVISCVISVQASARSCGGVGNRVSRQNVCQIVRQKQISAGMGHNCGKVLAQPHDLRTRRGRVH